MARNRFLKLDQMNPLYLPTFLLLVIGHTSVLPGTQG